MKHGLIVTLLSLFLLTLPLAAEAGHRTAFVYEPTGCVNGICQPLGRILRRPPGPPRLLVPVPAEIVIPKAEEDCADCDLPSIMQESDPVCVDGSCSVRSTRGYRVFHKVTPARRVYRWRVFR